MIEGKIFNTYGIGVHMIEEYKTDELLTIKQGQTLKYPQPDTSQYDNNEIKTYYNEAMK